MVGSREVRDMAKEDTQFSMAKRKSRATSVRISRDSLYIL